MLLAAQAWIQVPLFLVVVGLVHLSQPRSPEYPVARGIQASSVLGHLDGEQSACHHVEARTAIFCRRIHSVQTEIDSLLPQPGEIVGPQRRCIGIEIGFKGNDLLANKPPHVID